MRNSQGRNVGTNRGNMRVIPRGWHLGGVISCEGGCERDGEPVGRKYRESTRVGKRRREELRKWVSYPVTRGSGSVGDHLPYPGERESI